MNNPTTTPTANPTTNPTTNMARQRRQDHAPPTPQRAQPTAPKLPTLTDRQAELLVFVWRCCRHDRIGRGPTYQELGQRFTISKRTAWEHVQALIESGCVESEAGVAYSMRMTDLGAQVAEKWNGGPPGDDDPRVPAITPTNSGRLDEAAVGAIPDVGAFVMLTESHEHAGLHARCVSHDITAIGPSAIVETIEDEPVLARVMKSHEWTLATSVPKRSSPANAWKDEPPKPMPPRPAPPPNDKVRSTGMG